MRLFIAINLNDETKNALIALRDELRSRAERGGFSHQENLHLTLAFLGECSAKQADFAATVMDSINFEPFDMLVERVGRFGRGSEAVWWAGIRESNPLIELQRSLTGGLAAAGFALDTKKFSPHITLGRRVVTDCDPWRIEAFGETVRKIDLMKSERIDGELTYTMIYTKHSRTGR